MASHDYNLRNANRKRSYREMNTLDLPRVKKTSCRNKLYPIKIVERDGSRVKIHYVGYNSSNDEWREQNDIITLSDQAHSTTSCSTVTQVQPFSLYQELGIRIKQALTCGRKQSPSVKITMGFDYLLFKGGLQAAGIPKSKVGVARYKIQQYSDLDCLFGHNWHYRGINKHGDYAYVSLESIEFYLCKRRCLVEYYPPQSADESITESHKDTGYSLTFSFIRKCGNSSTFGKDKNIFQHS